MPLVPYGYLRVLELEGRQPPDDGGWGLTLKRLSFWEGLPPEGSHWAFVEIPEGAPLLPAPKLPATMLRENRCTYYRRLRTSNEVEDQFRRTVEPGIAFGLELFESWASPENGSIPDPLAITPPAGPTHVVRVIEAIPKPKRFRFVNTWGEKWGDNGLGDLSYSYFDNFCFSCWQSFREPRWEYIKKLGERGKYNEGYWHFKDEYHRGVYGYLIFDKSNKTDPAAWAFVTERDGGLEVEELFVRPEFRRQQNARSLALMISKLARLKNLPIRLWVDFADSQRESPSTFPAISAVAKYLGVEFQRSPLRMAAYFATNERSGSKQPIEPHWHPQRPQSTLKAVMAAAAIASGASSGTSAIPAVNNAASSVAQHSIEIGSEVWRSMNRRRAVLIQKKNRAGLSADEKIEFESLQSQMRAAVNNAFPRPFPEGGSEDDPDATAGGEPE